MKTTFKTSFPTPHATSIAAGTFLLVGSGETYSAEIVKGTQLLDKMLDALFGEAKEATPEQRQSYKDDIENPDSWHSDQDYGPTRWSQDIGETDCIDIFLITCDLLTKKDEALRHAKHALTWSKPIGGDSCNGKVSDEQSREWNEIANEKIDEAL